MISEMTESIKHQPLYSLGWLCLLGLVLFVHILHNTWYWDKATFQAVRDAGSRSLVTGYVKKSLKIHALHFTTFFKSSHRASKKII